MTLTTLLLFIIQKNKSEHVDNVFAGDGPLVMRVHAYLERYGYINFGVFKRLKPIPGTLGLTKSEMF